MTGAFEGANIQFPMYMYSMFNFLCMSIYPNNKDFNSNFNYGFNYNFNHNFIIVLNTRF